ncbi:hypothetical protein BZG36_03745 [Bifiguratus adelaidae]|uniref:ABC transporter domain-containing protein n=1 Tax=Bifiguratus adelaidae TaxID=1938954 RepID=A0A261XY62_9FUNG|nr:hypothetical protein BZG36_03745 [Bifiguratus adelaidae]
MVGRERYAKVPSNERHPKLDRNFLRRLKTILRILFGRPTIWFLHRNERRNSVLFLYLLLIGAACFNEVLFYYVGLTPSKFYSVLVERDTTGFWNLLLPAFMLLISAGLGRGLVKYIGGLFALRSRELLTETLQSRYIRTGVLYKLLAVPDEIDNPDQRITQDVDKLTETIRLVLQEIVITPILIAYYTWQCWNVGGFMGPLIIYISFLIGSGLSKLLMDPIVDLVFGKEKVEGEFRFLHMRLRQFGESIALARGEDEERIRISQVFSGLLRTQKLIVTRELFLQCVTEGFTYFGSIQAYLIIAIPILTGAYDDLDAAELTALISKNVFLSMYLSYKFNVVIDQATKLSEMSGYVSRIGQMLDSLEQVNIALDNIDIDEAMNVIGSRDSVTFDNATIETPEGKTIVKHLDLEIRRNANLLITGPNGSGKTSLIRVMCGLWKCVDGSVDIPRSGNPRHLLVLPQVAYMASGSLRDQITYPSILEAEQLSDEQVEKLVRAVGLEHFLDVCTDYDAVYTQEWLKMLSPGEQQKLAFARVLFWRPQFAILDESTSSMDTETEQKLYHQCQQIGITLISVSHNPALRHFHQQELSLDGRGNHHIVQIET